MESTSLRRRNNPGADIKIRLSAEPVRPGVYSVAAVNGDPSHPLFQRELNLNDDNDRLEFATEVASRIEGDFDDILPSVIEQVDNAARPEGPILRCLSDVARRPLEWLWPDRIALGKLTLLFGDPGLGKSFISIDMAARVSTGSPWPDGTRCERGSAIIVNAEDDAADTIGPRLDAASGDDTRVVVLDGVRRKSQTDAVSGITLADIKAWRQALEQLPDARLLIIDPVSAFLDKTDSHKNAEIRGLLAPLSKLAEERRVAVVLVTHLNKSTGGRAIARAIGSIGFAGAARSAWLVVKDEADDKRRLLLPAKNNLSAEDNNGLAFRIIDGAVSWERDSVQMQADDALAAVEREPKATRKGAAEEWLRNELKHGPMKVKDLQSAAAGASISWSTIRRAQDSLGIVPNRSGFTGGAWQWALPGSKTEDAHEDAQISCHPER